MTSITSRLRTRLDTLWKAVSDKQTVSDHVSDDFLSACNIRLIQHHFEATDDESHDESTYLSYDPPILFVPCPQSAIDDHPFDLAKCISPLSGTSVNDFKAYKPRGYVSGLETGYLSWFLENWAINGFVRQNLPPNIWSLSDLSYIVPIR